MHLTLSKKEEKMVADAIGKAYRVAQAAFIAALFTHLPRFADSGYLEEALEVEGMDTDGIFEIVTKCLVKRKKKGKR
jgi:hypothetical protein